MIFEPESHPPQGAASRCLLTFFGAVALLLLITARCLEPAAEGFGTHQALGFPPCNFQLIFDTPCPACGMTTSWSLLTRGRFVESIQANVGGFLMGLAAAIFGTWMLVSGIRGKWLFGFPRSIVIITTLCSILGATAVNWVWQLLG